MNSKYNYDVTSTFEPGSKSKYKMVMFERDYSLSEADDFEQNVKPHITEGFEVEEIFSFKPGTDHDPGDEEGTGELAGWWIIPVDYYERLCAETEEWDMYDESTSS